MEDLSTVPWEGFPLTAGSRDEVSRNFPLYELTRSNVADRMGIDNSIKRVTALRHAVYLCRRVLQPVRDRFGRLSPNSFFRGQELERALKKKKKSWKSRSQHTKGQACDIEIIGRSTMSLAEWVRENLEFDQLICECYNPSKGPNSGWVHVSVVPPSVRANRGDVSSYVFDANAGRYVYIKGLHESP